MRLKKALAPMILVILIAGCKFSTGGQSAEDPTSAPNPPSTPESPPTPTPTPTPSPTLIGSAPIASNFDYNLALQAAWGTGAVPAANSPDVVGAFRFVCGAGQLLSDDPIVYPGQPGKSHLHQFYGNTSANASSTFSSLRGAGESTCNNGPHAANRSAYWMPAMLDDRGNAVRPDYVTIYYKRRPASDPKCSQSSGDAKAEGDCVAIPNGLRFIFGYNMLNPADTPTGEAYFNCDGPTGAQGHYATIKDALAHCPTAKNPDGSYNRIGAIIQAPECWDGKNLDSADHRSHVAYPSYGSWGFLKCPSTHPYVIPTFTMGAWYTVDENLPAWHLSSDEMMPGMAPGSTLHADYFEAWDSNVKQMWTDGCINKMLNCSGGDLGNGKQLKGAAQPSYGWTNPQRLVPVS